MNKLKRIKQCIVKVPKWRLVKKARQFNCPKCMKRYKLKRGQYRYCKKCGYGYPWDCNSCNYKVWPDREKLFWVQTRTGKLVQCPRCGAVI